MKKDEKLIFFFSVLLPFREVRKLVALIRIKLASFTFQLVQIIAGGIIWRTWSSIEGFRTMNTRGLNGRTQVCQTAQQISQPTKGSEACKGI